MKTAIFSGLVGATALTISLAAPQPVVADEIERHFKGKQVTIVIGFAMGGTYGLYAQLLARHMGKHVPGQPTITVQSMPGAGGIKASSYAYNVMAKDGTGWLMPPDSIVISNLLERDKVRYEADRFHYLGVVAESNAVIGIRADKGVRTVDDARRIEVIVGSTGTGSQTFLIPSLANAVLGTRFKIVLGYRGSQEIYQAMERGEVDANSVTWNAWRSSKPDWLRSGYVVPFLQVGMRKDPELPNVPMVGDLVQTSEDKQIVALMASLAPIGRSLAVPPEVPADRVAALRAAFEKTIKDPAFVEEGEKRRLDLNPMTGPELQKIVVDIMKTPDAVVERARERIMSKASTGG